MMVKPKTKTEERIRAHGEVFTPNKLVNQMLSKLPKRCWRQHKTFLDNSCGNGQFLIHVLWRKISRGHNPLQALQSIFGADIMKDNIRECRLRLLKVISIFEIITPEHIATVFQNIVWINPAKHPTGSLEYDFSFANKPKQEDVGRWMKQIDNLLAEVELPVDEEAFLKTGEVEISFE